MTQALKKDLVVSIDEIIFSTIDECAGEFPDQVIFEIKKLEQVPMGFTSIVQLKEFTADADAVELKNILVRNAQSTHWIALFEHPSFQRRKPQLVALDSIEQDDDREFYIVTQGLKHGPYEKIQLQAMLEQNEILLTDMVSSNSGHTWQKLFHLDGFERRALKDSNELPEIPTDIIEEGSDNIISLGASTDVINNLAFLSKKKKSNSAIMAIEALQSKITSTVSTGQGLSKLVLVLSIMGIVYFAFNIKDQLQSPFEDNTPSIGEHTERQNIVETLRAVESVGESQSPRSINNQGRFETKELKPIRPIKTRERKSFMQTQTFKNAHQNESQNSNEYYDDTTPMELDPVRAQVDRDIYNDTAPEEVYPEEALFEEEVNN